MASNFDKCSAAECDPLGSLYDYGSVMHYDNTSFRLYYFKATIFEATF
jgi:hypothetical protein